MTRAKNGIGETLDRLLARHKDPAPDRMGPAIDRVRARLEADVTEAATLEEVNGVASRPRPRLRPAVLVTAAVAAMVAIAISGVLVRRTPGGGAEATVEAVDGTLTRISASSAQTLGPGDGTSFNEILRTSSGAGAQLKLVDGSRVEMRSQSELSLERADDGVRIRLTGGGIIVDAAKQQAGHLYVQTRDMTVSVVGTVFLVNAERDGSRVAVIEGEVRVHDGTTETKLRPGEQVSTSLRLETRPVTEEIAWSRQAQAHTALLQQSAPQMPAQTDDQLTPAPQGANTPAPPAQAGAEQPAASPLRFEEASIRPCPQDTADPSGGRGGGVNSLVMTPGRFRMACMTLATIIRTAYGYAPLALEVMNPNENGERPRAFSAMRFDAVYGLGVEDGRRVRGGPDWVRSDKYTIEAIADGAVDAQTMTRSMLQELLERRFQVKAHIEAEQVPAFALAVANGGLKLKPMKEGDCSSEPLSEAIKAERERRGWGRGPVLITEAGRLGIKPTCGTIYGEPNGPNYRYEHVAQSPGSVASALGGALDMRVVDRTGITEKFIFAWEFLIDETTPGALRQLGREKTWTPRPGWDNPSTVQKAALVFTVLEQQLGLKIEAIRVPREFIVIDRVERPSPN